MCCIPTCHSPGAATGLVPITADMTQVLMPDKESITRTLSVPHLSTAPKRLPPRSSQGKSVRVLSRLMNWLYWDLYGSVILVSES